MKKYTTIKIPVEVKDLIKSLPKESYNKRIRKSYELFMENDISLKFIKFGLERFSVNVETGLYNDLVILKKSYNITIPILVLSLILNRVNLENIK
jgi:hypothetical protein